MTVFEQPLLRSSFCGMRLGCRAFTERIISTSRPSRGVDVLMEARRVRSGWRYDHVTHATSGSTTPVMRSSQPLQHKRPSSNFIEE
jgi:hypothetical protein